MNPKNFKFPTLTKITRNIANTISNIFFKRESKEDAKVLIEKTSVVAISCSAPMAHAEYALDTANDVIDCLSTDPRYDTLTLLPYQREQKIGENLGNASRKLAQSLEETFESKNPKKLFGNGSVPNLVF